MSGSGQVGRPRVERPKQYVILDLSDLSSSNESNLRSARRVFDELVPRAHGRVVEVLGIVKKHGVENVGIAVKAARTES